MGVAMNFFEKKAWENVLVLDPEFDEWEYGQVIETYQSNWQGQQSYTPKWVKRKIEKTAKEVEFEKQVRELAQQIKVTSVFISHY